MSIATILGDWARWSRLLGNSDDDWVDRLNHIWTVVLLVLFALINTTDKLVGENIHCWANEDYAGNMRKMDFVKSHCWVQNTYYVPIGEDIPIEQIDRRHLELSYYQWVPYILMCMALMFKLPSIIWRSLHGLSGINIHKVVDLTVNTQIGMDTKREDTINYIAIYMDKWLETNREYHWNVIVRLRQKLSRVIPFCNKREGTYLTGLYLFIKFLFVVNVIGQFFLLNAFLGGFFNWWGIEAISSLRQEALIKESKRFPRVVLCDFRILQLKNVQHHTVQCILPINIFNEKIFLFLWFWLVLVSAVTCINFLSWVWRVIFRRNRVSVIKKYLKISDRLHGEHDKKICHKFANNHLGDDGTFLLRIVQKNSNDMLLMDLVNRLYDLYLEKPMVKKLISNHNEEIYICDGTALCVTENRI